jgi:hypothetical protein
LRLHASLSVEVLRQLESCLVEAFLPVVGREQKDSLERLLDGQATFAEKMRFFQQHTNDFEAIVSKAFRRFYQMRHTGAIASVARRKSTDFDLESFQVAVDEIFADLEECLTCAMVANAPEDKRSALKDYLGQSPPLVEALEHYREYSSGLGAVIFDALFRFENKMSRPQPA